MNPSRHLPARWTLLGPTNIVLQPAALPASMSDRVSPIIQESAASIPWSLMAFSSIPGFGLRHAQPSE